MPISKYMVKVKQIISISTISVFLFIFLVFYIQILLNNYLIIINYILNKSFNSLI